jgi:hypothetical protein
MPEDDNEAEDNDNEVVEESDEEDVKPSKISKKQSKRKRSDSIDSLSSSAIKDEPVVIRKELLTNGKKKAKRKIVKF